MAANPSVEFIGMFPTIAVSAIDIIGSEIPAIIAGKANLLISFKDTFSIIDDKSTVLFRNIPE